MSKKELYEELEKLGIVLNNNQKEQLEEFYNILIEENKKINLTRIVEKEDVYLKHFYDSLTITKVIDLNSVNNLCDIGTGAGFPGLVLKIVFPKLKVTLVDSLNKRINFLNIVIKELDLKDIETIHCRAEEYGMSHRNMFDVVTARAVAQTNILLEYAIPIVKKGGYFIPMKGNIISENDFSHAMKVLDVVLEEKVEFLLPIEESKRTLLRFKKIGDTSKVYPRKNNEMKKKPL